MGRDDMSSFGSVTRHAGHASDKRFAKSCQVMKAESGLPGSPSQAAALTCPKDTGLPGLIATPLKMISAPIANSVGFM